MQSQSLQHFILSRVDTESSVANEVEKSLQCVHVCGAQPIKYLKNKHIIFLYYVAFVLFIPTFQM